MRSLRRRLASCALAVVLLQCALLFAAPVSACCATAAARAHATGAESSAIECCPAGAHAPGQCPLHKQERSADCALRCGQTHAPDFVLGAVGILPPPTLTLAPPAALPVDAIAMPRVVVRAIRPDGPPPRSL